MAATYTDVDLSFNAHPLTGDLIKKNDLLAVKQSLRNLFMTNKYESPFNPNFGLGIGSFLFENIDPITSAIILRKIREQVSEYEPRCVVENIDIQQEDNSINITFSFYVIGISEQQTINLTLERTR